MVSKRCPDGSRWLQYQGKELEIVSHLGNTDFKVKFEDSPVFKAQIKEICSGGVKDRMYPEVVGVGFMGWGMYPAKVGNANTPAYEVWRGIIRRCYDPTFKGYNSYGGTGVFVDLYWHNFQNFAKWYYHQRKVLGGKYCTKFDVDKDLKGGKVYSEDNCTLLPYKLNNFIQVQDSMKGDMGYIKNSRNPYNRITTTISLLGKQVYISAFREQGDANLQYHNAKVYVTKLLADKYAEMGLISKTTHSLLLSRYGTLTGEMEEFLLSVSPTLESRIKGLLLKDENLLSRVRGKLDEDIYL